MPRDAGLSKITEARFRDLVERASFLGRELLAQAKAKRFAERGEIIYVQDTDVVHAAAAPMQVGPETDYGRLGVGQLLSRRHEVYDLGSLSKEQRAELRDRRIIEDRLAIRVTDLLVQALRNSTPTPQGRKPEVYVLPSHADEQERLLKRFKREADSVSGEAGRFTTRVQTIQNHLKASVAKAVHDNTQFTVRDVLQTVLDRLMTQEIIAVYMPQMALKRYEAVTHTDLDLETFEALKFDGRSDHNSGGLQPFEVESKAFLEWYWRRRLGETKVYAAEHAPDRIASDAAALADLAVYNRRLIVNDQQARVVLVTADRNLVKATYGSSRSFEQQLSELMDVYYKERFGTDRIGRERQLKEFFFEARPNERSGRDPKRYRNWFDRFGFHYVRHIQAFAHETITESEPDTQKDDSLEQGVLNNRSKNLSTIFSGLFAEREVRDLESPETLEKLALGQDELTIPDDYQARFADALDQWDHLLQDAVRNSRLSLFGEDRDDEVFQKINTLMSEDVERLTGKDDLSGKELFENAALWLAEYVDRTRERSMLEFSHVGTEILIKPSNKKKRPDGWIVRNPPDLSFVQLQNTLKMFENLATQDGYRKSGSANFHRDFANIGRDAPVANGKPDELIEMHLKFLVLGAAFAAAEKWSAALTHALRAFHILNRQRRLDNRVPPLLDEHGNTLVNFSGREAKYLIALCYKTLARTPDDLKAARAFLRAARLAYDEDEIVAERSAEAETFDGAMLNDTLRIEMRHDVEELSIAQAEYYLTRADCSTPGCNASGRTDATPCRPICAEAAQKLFKIADDLFAKPAMAAFLQHEKSPTLTDMSFAVYVIQLHAIRQYWLEHLEEEQRAAASGWRSDALLKSAVECLSGIARDQTYVMSHIATLYRLVGDMLVNGSEPPAEFADKEAINRTFGNIRAHAVTHFDEWRLQQLRDFVQKRVAQTVGQ